jgi:hypothetical protein
MPGVDTPLHVVLRSAPALLPKVRYVFDTLFMAAGIAVNYVEQPPGAGSWVLYGQPSDTETGLNRCLRITHSPEAWRLFSETGDVQAAVSVDGLTVVLPQGSTAGDDAHIAFDLAANAFYFLSSWSERVGTGSTRNRQLYSSSVFAKLAIPQDIVDRYLARLRAGLNAVSNGSLPPATPWSDGSKYVVVLSHDVDFVSESAADTAKEGVKAVLRHLLRQHDVGDAARAGIAFVRTVATGRDPYSGVREIIEREKALGVGASFQVAVGHRHPNDVNYRVENDRTRDYLSAIANEGFDLCLHGSYRSSENPEWYAEEVRLLERRLGTPRGSRQHFLSFEYDKLFQAQESSGIEYDMSMGYPDRIGPRAGFSFPYFPYSLAQDRPYRVLQISLFLMDVTLRSYMGLKGREAWSAMETQLQDLSRKGGCASVVWHPIVFAGARDPGYQDLFWNMVGHVRETGGLATDGRTVNALWRKRAATYPSFSG